MKQKQFYIVVFLALFLAFGRVLEKSSYFSTLRAELQKFSIPSPPAKFGKRVEIMEKLGLKYALPADFSRSHDMKTVKSDPMRIVSLYSSRLEYREDWPARDQVPWEKLPSSLIVDQEIISKGLPILSVAVDKNDLHDRSKGIFSNSEKKGKSWERPCFVSYYDKGKLLFATGAGVRVHGGAKRRHKIKSLRLYFRDIYGEDQFRPGIIFDKGSEPLRHLIVLQDKHFVRTVALDISRRIGCVTPHAKPVMLYLNGSRYGDSAVLTEHLSTEYLLSHYGHEDFVLLRTNDGRRIRRRSVDYMSLVRWARDPNIPMTMREVDKRVDVENLSLWWISQLFCAGNTIYQGPIVLDKSKPDSKWFWVNWDMDQSFKNNFEPEKKHTWEQELNFYNVINNPEKDKKNRKTRFYQGDDPRAVLFRRMSTEDPEFKEYFQRLFMNVMNHKLTLEFLKSRVDYYEKTNIAFGVPDTRLINGLRLFIKHRPEYLRTMMQGYLGSPESFHCKVNGPKDLIYEIDGFSSKSGYEGWYFKGCDITVNVRSKSGKPFSYWMVNGQKIESDNNQLRYTINSATSIEPIFAGS